MPSIDIFETSFPNLPPFPQDVHTVPLLRLSLQKLLSDNVVESERLWDACTKLGFFYLDLRKYERANGVDGTDDGHSRQARDSRSSDHTDGPRFVEDADRLFDVANEFFALPVEEKAKYDLSSEGSYFGYKGYGANFVDKKGNRDRNEYYNVSKDDILSLTPRLPQPKPFDVYRPLLYDFINNAHSIVSLLLERLNQQLGLERIPGPVLPDLHKKTGISGDQVRFIRAPPQPMDDRQVALGAHTDFGSVTLLFNKLGGLQVYAPEELEHVQGQSYDGWLYVKPLPGHCIVNLGDAMVKFTGGLLKSATHRVVNPPGEEQGKLTRHSLVYFARPEDNVMLKALKGRGSRAIDDVAAAMERRGEVDEEISAKNWILRRALGRRGAGGYTMKDDAGTETRGSR